MDAADHGTGRAILIAGPTASGKSALALRLAAQLGGVVFNADSMQVYADLSVLTARPSPAETARVPHRLFGHVDAAEPYSVGRWLDEIGPALAQAWRSGRVPILVGGSGLYIRALTNGLAAIPSVPAAVRERVRAQAEGVAAEDLHRRLASVDPDTAARLRPTDPQRIVRALEVFAATGRSLASLQVEMTAPQLPWDRITGIYLSVDRTELNARIDRRFDMMMEAGALDEVRAVQARRLDPALPAMRALGVPPLLAHLRGDLSLAGATAQGKLLTRRYAKRQATFARSQLGPLPWATHREAERILRERWFG